MNAEHFLDTTIVIYMFDETDATKRHRAEELVRTSLETGTGCISYQVVQEALNVVNRRLGFSADDTRTLLDNVLGPLWTVHPSKDLYLRGLGVQAVFGFSFYDSMIVAAALESGCARLYTEDLQHGQKIGALTVEDPFRP